MVKKETNSSKQGGELTVEETKVYPVEVSNEPKKVGQIIFDARKLKKLDVVEVAEKLRIRRSYLEAIEKSNYETLPCFPYGVGFVRSYADFLGLDGVSLADAYKKETNLKEKNTLRVIDNGDIVNDSTIPSQAYLILSIVAVLLIYFGWLFVNKYYAAPTLEEVEENALTTEIPQTDFSFSVDEVAPAQESEAIQVIDTTNQGKIEDGQITIETGSFDEASLQQQNAPSAPTSATPAVVEPVSASAPVVTEPAKVDEKSPITGKGVEILMKKETWLEVKDGNKLYVSKEFKKGDYYKVPEFPNMILSIGRVEGADVYVNGKLTPVFTNFKKMNVSVDKFLENAEH